MLLRLSLIIAIVAGLAALYFTHVNVHERITGLTDERDAARAAESQARSDAQKARSSEAQARKDLEVVTQELADRTATLEATGSRLAEQEKRANKLFEDLTQTIRQRNEAQQQLAPYLATGVPPDQILTLRDRLTKAMEARDAHAEENKVLNRQLAQVRHRLETLIGTREPEVELPAGLQGRVVAVDPRYDFVVLDIGEQQGVREDGQLLVNRNGQLIAKVRVTRVEPNRSIANVISEWKQDDIMEGDVVFY